MFNLFKKKPEKMPVIKNDEYPPDDKLIITKPMTIVLDEIEAWRFDDFKERHLKCVRGKFGAIGGGISINVRGTGLGNIFQCKCHGCGAEEDITNVDNW